MDVLTLFGSGDDVFIFDTDNQISLSDNFRNSVQRHSKLPGVSGALDEYGNQPAPLETGQVRISSWFQADTAAIQTNHLRDIGSMWQSGLQRLYKQPMGDGLLPLYCEAKLDFANITQQSRTLPRKQIRVDMGFSVANPGWLGAGTESPIWGAGEVWGAGSIWGGSATPVLSVGTSNEYSITPGGNAIIYPRILISIPTMKSATNITIQRIYGGSVQDEVGWTPTLSAGDSLIINTRSKSVTLNGADAYNSNFTKTTVAWFSLLGGIDNTIRVLMDNPTDQANVTIKYFEVII